MSFGPESGKEIMNLMIGCRWLAFLLCCCIVPASVCVSDEYTDVVHHGESLSTGCDDSCGCQAEAACADFGGCLCCREKLTGNWFGVRPHLADSGITFDADVIQIYQGVAHGGVRQTFRYAGHGDYLLGLDFEKIAGWQGFSLQLRGEHRFGQFLASDAGLIAPAALHAATPTIETTDLILTNVLFTQVVNENLTVLFGKMDTLDGDRNPFASGRGKTQFMNTSLVEPVRDARCRRDFLQGQTPFSPTFPGHSPFVEGGSMATIQV